MKIYKSIMPAGVGGQIVYVVNPDGSERVLKHIVRHSPDGFNWGYGGSGPADLALSILWDCLGPKLADKYYQQFKRAFIEPVKGKLRIREKDIKNWLIKIEKNDV